MNTIHRQIWATFSYIYIFLITERQPSVQIQLKSNKIPRTLPISIGHLRLQALSVPV